MIGRSEEEARKKESEKQPPGGRPTKECSTEERTYTASEVADLMYEIEKRQSARARKEPETEGEAEEEPAK